MMADVLIFLTMGLPWLGALAVWLTGNRRPHNTGWLLGFALAAALDPAAAWLGVERGGAAHRARRRVW